MDPSASVGCSPAQLQAYLARVGHRQAVAPDAATLRALHQAHVGRIAFENLEIHLGRAMRIEPDHLFADLVARRRGGYCFQMNELFARVLLAIGFGVDRFAARVWVGAPAAAPPCSHQCLRVTDGAGGRWLADVGFGGSSPLWPVAWGRDALVDQAGVGHYRMTRDPAWGWQLRCRRPEGGDEAVLYSFCDHPQLPVDFVFPNWSVSTMPDSRFVRMRMASRVEPGLRQHLLDGRFAEVLDGARRERQVDLDEEERLLREVFGLDVAGIGAGSGAN